MGKQRPMIVWVSVTLLIGVIAVLTWQAIFVYGSTPTTTHDPDALMKASLAMGSTLAAIWLFDGLPAVLALSGSRLCRLIVTIAAVPGLLALVFYHQPGGWGPLLISLKVIQLFAIALLYVGPSRAFFGRDPES